MTRLTRRRFLAGAAGAIAVACSGATSSPPATPTLEASLPEFDRDGLRRLAAGRAPLIGAALRGDPLRDEPAYGAVFAHEFGIAVPEHALKFAPVHPERDRYDFAEADAVVDFAARNGIALRGHTLVWHEEIPPWLENARLGRGELTGVLTDHIRTVAGRYRGRLRDWDVVNEAVEADGSRRRTIWQQGLGNDYLDLAFHLAHEADPTARLFYNDYGAEDMGRKSDAVLALVSGMKARGVPVHGIGLQCHFELQTPPDLRAIEANMARIAAEGFEVQVTELDVRIPTPVDDRELQAQAALYRDLLVICRANPRCTAYVMWGFTDRHSWVTEFRPGFGAAHVLDASYAPKPAYGALEGTIRDG